ncbi:MULTISPECIES: DUF2802 domain-containing protein [Rhodanobacter]|uniref:DUF2802 domain-containing protein n=1 Tax=Rhodanobacter TaxID=75309 RepID=UPI000487D726|nr:MULTISPECIES: DUF2802 domain-containing protein [Rhodanobacter]TAN16742.1 MAG: DUF2802 domain-containing protein [Rhodanobacter sp.]UJJ54242.1 DUF2802 domain-containing protein [Rhodanobacter thiooxydans]
MWLELGVAVLLLLALAQSLLLWHGGRQLRELQRRVAALSHEAGFACTDVPTSMLVTVLGRLERQLGRAEQPPLRQSYELAQRLAREGADVEQLVSRCGLSRDEAKLVLQMHPAGS